MKMPIRFCLTVALWPAILYLPLAAAETSVIRGATELGGPVDPVIVHIDMHTLPEPVPWKPGDPIREVPQRTSPPKDWVQPPLAPPTFIADPLLDRQRQVQSLSAGRAFDTPIVNVNGTGFTGVNPSDTIGDVGFAHYVQVINGGSGTRVLILDKSDGSQVLTFNLPDLATGSGTTCASGVGDPVVVFDETVDNGPGSPSGRWLLSEFTNTSFCVYISQTADPTAGTWFVYQFISSSGGLPDYPKYAAWPDAYYIGANENGAVPGNGRTLYALDRDNMLQGLTARPAQVLEVPTIAGFGFQMLQPADWDGIQAPPAGSPAFFLRHRDDEVHNAGSSNPAQDFVELWAMSVDWNNAANTSVSGPVNIAVSEFESELCGLTAFACVPQPNSATQLDPLREPVMWRAQYRNFGSHETIVGSFVSDVDGGGADHHGVRWFEMRKLGAGQWSLFQEGTVAPDARHRWMSSSAMDTAGNIALGYNISDGSSQFPGMRYIGRLQGDPAGTMPRGENLIIDGTSPNGSNRYGDYSSINVDPIDGCTFWYTAQYNPASQWATRIASFRFDACGDPGFFLVTSTPSLAACTLGGAAALNVDFDVTQINGFADPVTLGFNPPPPAGITGGFTPNPAVPPATVTMNLTVGAAVPPGNIPLNVLGTAAGAADRNLGFSLDVFTAVPNQVTLTSPPNGDQNVAFQPVLEWQAIAQGQQYVVEVATDNGFTDIVFTQTLADTSTTVVPALPSNSQFFWRVRALNECGTGTDSQVFTFTTAPAPGDCQAGVSPNVLFMDDIESGSNGWTTPGGTQNQWAISTARPFSGANSWFAPDLASISDQRLVSPAIALPGADELPIALRFQTWQTIESSAGGCFDGGILEISTDDGATWTPIDGALLLTLPYDGVVDGGFSNPLAGLNAWCGDPRDWTEVIADLNGFAGQTVRFRFRLGTDSSVPREGWYIDDVAVQSCPAGDLIFADSFENLVP